MMSSNKIKLAFVLLFPLMGLTGCYPFLYHPPLQQGNVINPNAVAQLKTGMTKDQVTSVMGSPILQTPFTPDTWHYVYTLRLKDKLVQHKQITLYFNQNRLIRISAD